VKLVDVKLGGPTKYMDQPAVPDRFRREFKMWVWDDGEAEGELRRGGPAPKGADDCVSQTIISHGVWEVPETIFMLSAFAANPKARFIDLGCQIGWFSLLAASSGLQVEAVDANRHALSILRDSAEENGWINQIMFVLGTVDHYVAPVGPLIVKIDVEGAENIAVAGLAAPFAAGLISHCLIEVSPVFENYYPDLLAALFDVGYQGWVMPEKRVPPRVFKDAESFLLRHCRRLDYLERDSMRDWVQAQHQFDVILVHPEATWA
jgi:SAM-dependent methyltransferase